MLVEDVDLPWMGVQAPEHFDGGFDYSSEVQVATEVELDGAEAEEKGEVERVEVTVHVTSLGGGTSPSPAQPGEERGSMTRFPGTAVHPPKPAVVYAATASQHAAPAAVYDVTSTHPMAQARMFAATTTQPSASTSMYSTTSSGVVGPAAAYVATAMQSPAPVLMYLATTPQAAGPSGVFDPMFELLEGEGGDFGGVLQSLAEFGWPGAKIRDVLNAFSKL